MDEFQPAYEVIEGISKQWRFARVPIAPFNPQKLADRWCYRLVELIGDHHGTRCPVRGRWDSRRYERASRRAA